MNKNYLTESLRQRLFFFDCYRLTYADSRIIVFNEDKLLNLEPVQSADRQVVYILDNGNLIPGNEIHTKDTSDMFTLDEFNFNKRMRLEAYLRIMYGMFSEDHTKEYYIKSILEELLRVGITSAPRFETEFTKFVCENYEDWMNECIHMKENGAKEAESQRIANIRNMPLDN